jgi:Domain of unknown function (DUF1929)/Domain of unknown function DUF11
VRHAFRLAAALATLCPAPLLANDVEGAWSDVFEWPVTAIHMSLLHTGHIVLWSDDGNSEGHGEPFLLDPTDDCFEEGDGCFTEKPIPVNIFCGGHAQLSDGSLLVNGGHIENDVGEPDTFLFQYDREADDWNWTAHGELPDSHFARWYSTLTTLADGRVLNVSGSEKRCSAGSNADQLCLEHTDCGTEEEQLCEVQLVAPPEVFDPATRDWTLFDMIDDPVQYYPFNFVSPTGEVFFAGADSGTDAPHIPSTSGLFFDVEDGDFVPTGEDSVTDGGSAVMYRPGQVMKCGGESDGSGVAIATAEVIDLNVSNEWSLAQPMNIPRRRHNTTLLPDGTVLVTGGTRSGNQEFEFDGTCGGGDDGVACNSSNACGEDEMCVFNPSGAQQWVAEAEIWDPDADTWTLMAGSQTPRMYHSSALLLPDGRVLSAGGGPRRFGGAFNTYSDAEIFSPPYLFRDSERPVIDDAPEIIYYGNAFEVISEQAPDVEAVNLIRLGAVTHSFDQNTRFVPLSFAQGIDDTLDVQAPPNGNIAPPGYYMLFLISSDGVPSVARFVRILPPDPGADALYEYSAKIVCGRQEEEPAQRAAGLYATSVNIHNPFPAPVRFFKKLALTAPPGMQQPGEILPIGEDVLDYDEALQADCRELRQKLISTAEAPVIEGFLVIQSPTALDVTSVYTTSALADAGTAGAHSSIDIEAVSARQRASSDLSITKTLIPCPEPEPFGGLEVSPCDLIYTSGDTLRLGYQFRLFEVVVTNTGPDTATGILIDDELLLDYDPAAAVGATIIWGEDPIELPPNTEFTVQQPEVDRSRAEISLPDLEAGQGHTLRFWTVTFWSAQVNATVELVNTADSSVATIDSNAFNNSAAATAPLNP